MKKFILLCAVTLCAAMASAKDLKTLVVTTTPQMHCASCENKIKSNIRFEKGVKRIETNIPNQTVTIEFDAEKNSTESLIKAFEKFGYHAKNVTPSEKKNDEEKSNK